MANETANALDCDHCFLRDRCPDAEPGTFCMMWRSREMKTREPDPNDLWRRGEPTDF
ncbi:MAG: hypothetical protein ACSW8J_07430 [bacterium]